MLIFVSSNCKYDTDHGSGRHPGGGGGGSGKFFFCLNSQFICSL
jgi:hypothetical protein